MATGFALLSICPLQESEVFQQLHAIDEVKEVHPLFGEYDILLKIETESIDLIGTVIIKKIRSIRGIVDSKTLISTGSLSG